MWVVGGRFGRLAVCHHRPLARCQLYHALTVVSNSKRNTLPLGLQLINLTVQTAKSATATPFLWLLPHAGARARVKQMSALC